MYGFQMEALFWAENNVIEEPFVIISMLNEIMVTKLEFHSVNIRCEGFLNERVITIVDLMEAFF
jgi:hypothetical protein